MASKSDKKTTKQARKLLPKNQGWMTILYVLLILLWTAVSVVASQLVVGYIMLFMLGKDTFLQPVPTAICSVLSYVLALILTALVPPKFFAKWNKFTKRKSKLFSAKIIKRDEIGLKDLPTWTDIGLAPAGFVVYLLLAAGVTALFSQFTWFDAKQVQDVGFSVSVYGVDRMIAFLVLVVAAPIAEELIFRGWLYSKLRDKLNQQLSDVASMIMTALLVSGLFGCLHGQWNVGVNVFAMSLVLCGLREVTGTIYAGILMHMLKNGVAFYLLYVLGMS